MFEEGQQGTGFEPAISSERVSNPRSGALPLSYPCTEYWDGWDSNPRTSSVCLDLHRPMSTDAVVHVRPELSTPLRSFTKLPNPRFRYYA